MKKIFSLLLIIIPLFLFGKPEFDLKGRIAGASGINYNNDFNIFGSLQYLPIAEYQYLTKNLNYTFDIAGFFHSNFKSKPDADLYRLKFTLSGRQTEFRLGLQQLNFGPARMLRALQWFDTLSETDPLKLSDGVYGALFRHFFLNNNNLWLWSLYGNDELKGIEFSPTREQSFEQGGRFQFMIPHGEAGITLHHRKLEKDTENRIALDSRWDYFLGFWFESVFQQSDFSQVRMLTLGADYTFDVGNGLYFLAEHMLSSLSLEKINQNTDATTSALMLSYPVSLFDTFNTMAYFSWETGRFSPFVSYQRTLDNFIFNLNLFHFPEQQRNFSSYAGYGFEFKIIYNH